MNKSVNWNLLLIVGGAIAVFYFWNKTRTNKDEVLEAKLPIVESRTERVEIRQTERTERREDLLNFLSDLFNKKDTISDNTKDGKLRSKETNKTKLDYDTSSGVLKVNNLGFSVAPEKATSLRNQVNLTQAQEVYKNIVVNPYGALKV